MLAGAAEKYAHAFGVACGSRVVIAANSDPAYRSRRVLARRWASNVLAHRRPPAGRRHRRGSAAGYCARFIERRIVAGCRPSRGARLHALHPSRSAARGAAHFDCDLILSAGGYAPAVHLHSQAGGKLRWLEESAMFVPDGAAPGVCSAGACAGVFARDAVVNHAAALGHRAGPRQAPRRPPRRSAAPADRWPHTHVPRLRKQAVRRSAKRCDRGRRGSRRAGELSLGRAFEALHHHRHGHRPGQDQQHQCAGADGRIHAAASPRKSAPRNSGRPLRPSPSGCSRAGASARCIGP